MSALSSYRTVEKYSKLNQLTPFGIMVDALMVTDLDGIPCPIASFFDANGQLETSEREIKYKKNVE